MWAKSAIKQLLRPLNLVVPASVYGSRFKVPLMRGIGASHRRGSEPWMVDALARLFRVSGHTGLIDIGVNIGQTLLKAKSIDPLCRYVGFEPNPFCIHFVNELIRLNRFQNCRLLPVALSTRPGLVELIADSESDSTASMVQDLRPGRKTLRQQYIPTLVFDDIAGELDLTPTGVVKIDVEGAELEVLSGMKGYLCQQRPLVTCEVLHAHSAAQLGLMHERNLKLMELLDSSGYAPLRLLKNTGQTGIVGVEPIDGFPNEVFDHRSSHAVCDYLFIPREKVSDTVAEFQADVPSAAPVGLPGRPQAARSAPPPARLHS
jgi:FkbM family methyltransferase